MDINFEGIYSPGVTVFRNSEDLYSLMEESETFRLGIISVAALFNEILSEDEFRNKFRKITFAILDREGEKGKFSPFYKVFKK